MFCRKCGKQIPDGATFCTYCGAQQGAPAQPQPGQTAPESQTRQQAPPQGDQQRAASQDSRQQTPPYNQQQAASGGTGYQAVQSGTPQQKPKKKGTAILIPVLAFLLAAVLGRFVIAPAFMSDSNKGSETEDTAAPAQVAEDTESLDDAEDTENLEVAEDSETDEEEETEINPAYTELFLGTRVVHLPFMIGMDMENYAKKDEDGNIICRDYGYQGDQVLTYVETWYYPGVTADQQQTYNEAAQEEAARFSAIPCANITYEYNEASEYFVIKYAFTDLDQQENYQAMYDAGLSTGANGLSLSRCEEMAVSEGYIKK